MSSILSSSTMILRYFKLMSFRSFLGEMTRKMSIFP